MSNICSICGHDPSFDNLDALRLICGKHHLQSEHCNPGGRELIFMDRGALQISGICNICDEKEIRKFLGEMKSDRERIYWPWVMLICMIIIVTSIAAWSRW